jgi:hypothetical protein
MEVQDKSSFLAKYTSVSQCSEDVLTEALLFLEEDDSELVGDTGRQKFSLNLDLSSAVGVFESLSASVSLVPSSATRMADEQKMSSVLSADHSLTEMHKEPLKPPNPPISYSKVTKSAGRDSVSTGSSKTESTSAGIGKTGSASTGGPSKDVAPSSPVVPRMDHLSAAAHLKPLALKRDSKVKVLVTEVHSVKEFWIQPLSHDLETMSNKMKDHFAKASPRREPHLSQKPPTKGSFVAAQFTYDNEWYRAKVMDVVQPTPHASPLVKVFYVDYGNQEVLSVIRLQPLPPQFCVLPTQAICCCLEESETRMVSKEALRWFKACVPEQAGVIQVQECATLFSYIVRLWIPLSQVRGVDPAVLKMFSGQEHVSVLNLMMQMSLCGSTPVSPKSARCTPVSRGSITDGDSGCGSHDEIHMQEKSSESDRGHVEQSHHLLSETSVQNDGQVSIQPSTEKVVEKPDSTFRHASLTESPKDGGENQNGDQKENRNKGQNEDQDEDQNQNENQDESQNQNGNQDEGQNENWKNVSLSDFGSSVDLHSSSVGDEMLSATMKESQATSSLFSMEGALGKMDRTSSMSLDSLSIASTTDMTMKPHTLHDARVVEVFVEKGGFPLAVVSVTSPSLFYAHTQSAADKLKELQVKLDDHYNNLSSDVSGQKSGSAVTLQDGSLCAAKFSPEEDNWYRGVVADCRRVDIGSVYNPHEQKTEYHVHFMDYGDTRWVSGEDMFPLASEFLDVPILAVRLGLAGIAPCREDVEAGKEGSGWTTASAKKKRKPSANGPSVNVLPAGDEDDDVDDSCFQLRSPSDSNLQQRIHSELPLPHHSSAPDISALSGRSSTSGHLSVHTLLEGSSEGSDATLWPTEAVEVFTKFVESKVLCAVVLDEDLAVFGGEDNVIRFSSVTDVLPVQLYDTSGEKDVLINAMMVEKGLARIDDESLSSEDDRMHSTSLSPGMDSWDPIKNHFFNPASDFQRVLQSDREQVVQICWNFNSRRGCRFGDRCKFLHSSLRLFSERKTCKLGSHDIHMTPPLPKPKSWVVVEVITVVNPCLFYVHFPAGPASLLTPSTTPEENEATSSLNLLTEDMNTHYSGTAYDHSFGSLPAEGEMVAVRYHGDNKWYRARVLCTNDDRNQVEVFYVDFGNSEEVPESQIRPLLPEFLHLPFQAVECYLAGTTFKSGCQEGNLPYQAAVDAFSDLVRDRYLVAFVVSAPSSGHWLHSVELELYDTSLHGHDVCINTTLTEQGHLASVDVTKHNSPKLASSKNRSLNVTPG